MDRKSIPFALLLILALLVPACARKGAPEAAAAREERQVVAPEFISPEMAYERIKSGRAVLVCAYDDEDTCRRLHIDNAMSLYEFERNLMYLPKDKEIIFYCA